LTVSAPLRLRFDSAALIANWQWLDQMSGSAACGAAVKADGYGTDAKGVVARLAKAGCQDFFVATWGEALALGSMPVGASLSVLHGVRKEDMEQAVQSSARPVLCTEHQILRWKETGLPCDVMVDTGMNRLGVSPEAVENGLLEGLKIDTIMSHLACADEDHPHNERQRRDFERLGDRVHALRMSLANSAGLCLGEGFHFDLTRPGLALYGGTPRIEAQGHIQQVVFPEAQVVQMRKVQQGEGIGYNHIYAAPRDMQIAILNLGYADGYLRAFSGFSIPEGGIGGGGGGGVRLNGHTGRVIGRVSMDLIAIGFDAEVSAQEGDWVSIDYDLTTASRLSGLSPYELLTGLGTRFDRIWL
jgi:alanine racemase